MYINTNEPGSQHVLNKYLRLLIGQIEKKYKEVAIVCIGTDRATGDCYGPLVGHMLSQSKFNPLNKIKIFGTLEKPVHALNLKETIAGIDKKNSLIIAIDSSVSKDEHIGYIGIRLGETIPGRGVGKELPAIGDISISGIVTVSGIMPMTMLQTVPLGMVYKMAEQTSSALNDYVRYSNRKLAYEKEKIEEVCSV